MTRGFNPCPFCGESRATIVHDVEQSAHNIMCDYCYAQGPVFGTEDEAIEAWNEPAILKDPGKWKVN